MWLFQDAELSSEKREHLWGMREPDLFVVSVSTYILFSLYHVFLLSGRVCVCVWMPVCFIKMVHLTATHLTKQHTLGISRCWREVAIPELVNVVIVVVVMARETAMHSYYYHHHYSNSIAIVRRRLECVCVVGFIQCLITLSGENRVCGSFAKAKVCVCCRAHPSVVHTKRWWCAWYQYFILWGWEDSFQKGVGCSFVRLNKTDFKRGWMCVLEAETIPISKGVGSSFLRLSTTHCKGGWMLFLKCFFRHVMAGVCWGTCLIHWQPGGESLVMEVLKHLLRCSSYQYYI